MSIEDKAMQLPEGKTCADCYFYPKCSRMYGATEVRTDCDFFPSRFHERSRPVGEHKEVAG